MVNGLVIAGFRRHYTVRLDGGEDLLCVLKGRQLTLACGDTVSVTRFDGGGAIESVLPRTTLLYRSDAFREKLIAANVTQVVGVVAPDLGVDEELINRWIIGAEAERCRLVLAANKRDKPGFAALQARLAPFAALGYSVVPLAATQDVAPLMPWLAGQRSVLIGQSGMGKSTILNAILPGTAARTAEISEALQTGRHTTTHSTLHVLPEPAGGWVVDSPGMKAFGLAHLAAEAITGAFVELRPFIGHCRFRDCRHDREPGCAVREAVARGEVAPHRVTLLRTLVAASEASRRAQPVRGRAGNRGSGSGRSAAADRRRRRRSPRARGARARSRLAGESTIQPPPAVAGSGYSVECVVVWRPVASASEISAVRAAVPGRIAFRIVDLPMPDCPTSTVVRPASHGSSGPASDFADSATT